MSTIVMRAAPENLEVPRVREINETTVRYEILQLVADAALMRTVSSVDGDASKLQPSEKRIIDSIYRALQAITSGARFSAYTDYYGELTSFAMQSLSRPKIYVVSESSCQCESHSHNGYCIHRTTRQLIAEYFKIVRADENRARVYAELGIKLIEHEEVAYPGEEPVSAETFNSGRTALEMFMSAVFPRTGRVINLPASSTDNKRKGM